MPAIDDSGQVHKTGLAGHTISPGAVTEAFDDRRAYRRRGGHRRFTRCSHYRKVSAEWAGAARTPKWVGQGGDHLSTTTKPILNRGAGVFEQPSGGAERVKRGTSGTNEATETAWRKKGCPPNTE